MWREHNWQTSGKKTSEMAQLSGRFLFHILKNMAQIKKLILKRQWHSQLEHVTAARKCPG